jgi:dienelactone hydrolase
MNNRYIIALLFLVYQLKPLQAYTQKEVLYSYGGNFKALMVMPDTMKAKYPVILFCYDDFYDNVGEKLARERGYDLLAFADVFASWGYMTLIPLHTSQSPLAIRGAFKYLQQLHTVDKSEIHIVAASTQAISAILAHKPEMPAASLTLITPRDIDDTQITSTALLTMMLLGVNEKILILGTEKDTVWATQSQHRLLQLLQKNQKNVTLKTYLFRKPWFWNPKNPFIDDIHNFIDESTNTHKPL